MLAEAFDRVSAIAVTRDGQAFLGTKKVTNEELQSQVSDQITNRIDKTVYLKCDARSKYERVVEVVNLIRTSGVDNVGLLTEKEDTGGAVPVM